MKKIALSLVLLSTLLASCGQKNTVKSSTLTPFSSGVSYSSSTASTLSSIASTYSCNRRPSMVYGLTTSSTSTNLTGTLSTTPLSGSQGTSYVGVNKATRDMIIVTRMTNGSSIIGYNIELAYCAESSYTPPYFSSRAITGFYASYMTLSDSYATSGMGVVYANTRAYVAPYGSYPLFYLDTVFGAP